MGSSNTDQHLIWRWVSYAIWYRKVDQHLLCCCCDLFELRFSYHRVVWLISHISFVLWVLMTILEVWMATWHHLGGVGAVTQWVRSSEWLLTFFWRLCDLQKVSKKPCPAGVFDDTSSSNYNIEVGTHPGGWDDHKRSYKLATCLCNAQREIT